MIPFYLISISFLTGLSGPDGLYAAGSGIYICEETAGRVLFVTYEGDVTVAAEGLFSPEGICVTEDGRILVVEDTESGRLLEIYNGSVNTIADSLCCPEGVTVDIHGEIWFTTGGIQGGCLFTSLWRVVNGRPVVECSLPSVFSFSDLEAAEDGMIYICSESSGIAGDVAVFRFDPVTDSLIPFVTGITACEGIGMTDGRFPFYITGESGSVHRVDSTGRSTLLDHNFSTVEDVVVQGNHLFVSEDGTGSIIRLELNE
ncbi:MAG: hypothetical protein U9P42_01145 [Candidatus Fermentibacteria bacterium]|nr:hypothetical protein [Candidatus Fermentibacteria bacterium]